MATPACTRCRAGVDTWPGLIDQLAGRPYARAGARRPAADRGVRWRRLLDGARQHAAGRLRARTRPRAGRRTAARLLPAHGERGRGPLHRALLPGLLAELCEPSHLSLFRRERSVGDVREHLLTRDLIYVGGGSVISLMGTWRAHGIDVILREAWERGVVLCGLSAGSLCWFAEAVTAFHGPPQAVTRAGAPAVEQLRALRRRAGALRRLPAPAAPRGCGPASRPRTAPRCTSWASGSRAWSPRGQGARAHRMRWTGKRISRRPIAPTTWARGGAAAAGRAAGTTVGGGRLRRELPRAEDPRRIVAMGGGGFSARPAIRRSIATCWTSPRCLHPRICLLPTAGGDAEEQIRRFYAAFRHLPCEPTHVSLFRLGSRTRRPARACCSRAGRALRGRRQPAEPAGGVARARRRHAAARGVGARDRPVRHQRRLDVLVRGRAHHVVRRAAPGAGARLPAAAATRFTTTASPTAARATTRRSAPSRSRPATRSTTAPDCCSRAPSSSRRSAPGRAPARTGWRRFAASRSRRLSAPWRCPAVTSSRLRSRSRSPSCARRAPCASAAAHAAAAADARSATPTQSGAPGRRFTRGGEGPFVGGDAYARACDIGRARASAGGRHDRTGGSPRSRSARGAARAGRRARRSARTDRRSAGRTRAEAPRACASPPRRPVRARAAGARCRAPRVAPARHGRLNRCGGR